MLRFSTKLDKIGVLPSFIRPIWNTFRKPAQKRLVPQHFKVEILKNEIHKIQWSGAIGVSELIFKINIIERYK